MQDVNIQGSIRRRLLMTLLSGALVLSVGLFFVFQQFAVRLATESQDNILRASATAILDAASITQGELDLDLPYSAFSMLSNVSNDRVFYAVHSNGELMTGYDILPNAGANFSTAATFVTTEFMGAQIRLVQMSRLLSAGDNPIKITVSLGQTLDGQNEILGRILRAAEYVGLGVFLLVVVLALFSAKTTISPLVRLAQSVSRRGPNELRPVAAPVPTEMAPLVSSLNSFMERLKTSLSRSEEFIADAAHRLRTPLAIVRTRAEAMLMRVERDENRAALKDMIRAIDESSRAAGQMLDHAMVTLRADNLEKSQIDLAAVVSDLVERMSPAAELRDISFIKQTEPALFVHGDPVLIQSALRNLLDNAIKFAPKNSRIWVKATRDNGFIVISVTDEGAGFPQKDIEKLKGLFQRGTNAEGTIGSGLGLTIASDVSKAHGGWLNIENTERSGACASLYFPYS